MTPPTARRIRALQRRLGAWYERERRDLPWRRRRGDAYAVWISEAMLQQTRVETVIPYFERFLQRFPDVAALAAASEDDVVAAWSGLGYYRRARALRDAARVIVADHGGRFPEVRADVLALPGVGAYTAGAVLSIAFGQAEPLVDGNVARVFARWFAIEDEIDSAAARRESWALATRLVHALAADDESPAPGEWNQALMELGALVCTPRSPSCAGCPVATLCEARRTGAVERLPRRAPRRAPVDVRLETLVVLRDGRVLLERRPASGRMAGMWELPTREVPGGDERTSGLWPARHRTRLDAGDELHAARHSITHHRIRVDVRRGRCAGDAHGSDDASPFEWLSPGELEGRALTGMTRKILRARPVRAWLEGNGATAGASTDTMGRRGSTP